MHYFLKLMWFAGSYIFNSIQFGTLRLMGNEWNKVILSSPFILAGFYIGWTFFRGNGTTAWIVTAGSTIAFVFTIASLYFGMC